MKENDPPVPFAKVDATEEKDLGSRYEVSGYPTLKIFRKGEAHDYDGPRDKEGTEDKHNEKKCLNPLTSMANGSFSQISIKKMINK